MRRDLLKFAGVLVVILSALVFAGCASLQTYVEKNDWLPVGDLDLIQIVQSEMTSTNNTSAVTQALKSSSQKNTIIGSRMSVEPLQTRGFWWWNKSHVIAPNDNLMPPDYSYNVKYVKGPEKILKKQNFSVEVAVLNLGKWAKLGCSKIGSSNKLDLKNIIHGYVDFKKEDFLNLLQSLDTLAKEKTFLITDFIAADVTNAQAAGISCDADVNLGKYELKLAKINAGDTEETVALQGLGLLLGVRGFIIETTDSGSIDPFSLPKKNDYLLKNLPIGSGNKLRIDRNADNSIELRIEGASAAKVYYRDIRTGKWKLDSNTYALAKMPSEDHKAWAAAKSLNTITASSIPVNNSSASGQGSAGSSRDTKSIPLNIPSSSGNAGNLHPTTNTTDVRIVIGDQSVIDVVVITIHGSKDEAAVRMYRSMLKRANTTENYTQLAM
jgi:hypothetical protein